MPLPLLVLAAASWSVAAAQEQTASGAAISVLDGAYTAEQAARGKTLFRSSCAQCHALSAFKGLTFQRNWSGPASMLFEIVSSTMPEDSPASLSPRAYAQVLAYLLELNGYPPGERELPSDEKGLERIVIEPIPTP